MNFTRKKLKKIKEFYQIMVWVIVKRNKWGKRLPSYVKPILDNYNLILDLIEDLERKYESNKKV